MSSFPCVQARPTAALPSVPDGVFCRPGVKVFHAVRLGSFGFGQVQPDVPSLGINPMRDRLKMPRVDAIWVAAKVVYFTALRNRPSVDFIRKAISGDGLPVKVEVPIAPPGCCSSGRAAASGASRPGGSKAEKRRPRALIWSSALWSGSTTTC